MAAETRADCLIEYLMIFSDLEVKTTNPFIIRLAWIPRVDLPMGLWSDTGWRSRLPDAFPRKPIRRLRSALAVGGRTSHSSLPSRKPSQYHEAISRHRGRVLRRRKDCTAPVGRVVIVRIDALARAHGFWRLGGHSCGVG